MAYRLTITEVAERQLQWLTARDQRILEAAILARLTHQPTTPTRAIKILRPNPLAQYELRAGNLRVLYDVEGDEVIISIVGLKAGNTLFVAGEPFHGHQDRAPGSAGGGSEEDAD